MESPEVHKNVSLFHMELKGKDVKGLKGEIKEEIEDYHFQPNILDHKYDQKHTSTAMDMIDVKIEPKEESDPDMNKSKRGYKLIQVAQKSNVLHDVNNQGEQPDIYDDYFETTEDSDRRSFEIEDQERANASMDHELSFQLNEEEPANVEDRKRNKTKFSDPQQWKYNAAKRKREYGLEYTGRKGKEFNIKRPKRTLKNRCKCSKIDTKIQCFKISNDDREEIFKNFWKLKWPEKRLYVSSRVLSLPTARVRDRKEKCSSRRSVSHQYFLNIKSEQIRVCKTLFCNTLGVSDSTVTAWIGNDTQSLSKSDDSLIEQPNNYDVFEDSRLQMLEECRLTEKLFIAKNLFGSSVGIPTRFVNIIEGEDLFHLPVNDFNQGETVQDTSEANVKTNNIKYHEGLEKTGQVSDKANNELKSENLLKLEESDFENNKHKNNDYFEATEDTDPSFEVEDQERTNASIGDELSFQLKEEEPEHFFADDDLNNQEDRKRSKRKFSDPQKWKYNAAKRKREYGLEYTGRKGKEFNIKRPKKTLKDRCKCSKIDTKIQCFKISNEDREEIFKNFWKLKWPEKRLYVSSRILSLPTARVRNRKEKRSSRRSVSHQYFLNVKSEQVRVCKTLFCNTLCVSDRTVTAWIESDTQSLSKSDDSLIGQPNNYDVFEDSRLQMLEECRVTEKLFIAKNLFGSSVGIPTRFVNNIIESEDLVHLPVVNDFNQGETVQDASEANVKTNNIKYHKGVEQRERLSKKANNELKNENLLELEESDFDNNKHKNNDYFETTEDSDPTCEVEDQEKANVSMDHELGFELNEEEPEHFFADDDLNNQKYRKRSKRKFSDPQKWKYNAAKRKREYGLEYTGRKGKEFNIKRPKKTLKDRCKCSKINTKIQCFKVSNEDREEIFKNFWKLKWPEKRLYVSSRVLSLPTARVRDRKEKCSSRRSVSHQYFLNVKSEQIRVCKTLFCNTLCVSDKTVTAWIESDTRSLAKNNDSLIAQPDNYDVFEDSKLQMLKECRLTEKLFNAKNTFDSSVGISTMFVNNITEGEDLFHLPVKYINQEETVQDATDTNANLNTNDIKCHEGLEKTGQVSEKANNELKSENLLKLEDSDFENNKHKNNDYFETTEDTDPCFEVEDQERANASMDNELSFQLKEEEPEHFFADGDLNNQKYRKRSKRKFSDPQKWKYNAAKRKREYGLEYTGRKGKEFNIKRPKRTLKDRCKCSKIDTKIQCFKISNENREEIFKNFWKLKWSEKRLYVSSRVLSLRTARVRDRKEKCSSRRSVSHQYFLNIKSEQIRVCKTLFCNTLGVSESTVTAWIESDTQSFVKAMTV
uniref:Uncharacterized protein LOC114332212 isoform X2 n=1 Tax=Diabrotica virgifera virgifera TaxID=50390 RepID=A0A6P7FN93_DIAVI